MAKKKAEPKMQVQHLVPAPYLMYNTSSSDLLEQYINREFYNGYFVHSLLMTGHVDIHYTVLLRHAASV